MTEYRLPPIIDAHHHFWGGPGDNRPSRYWPSDYLEDIGDTDLRASVFMECLTHYTAARAPSFASVGETAFAAAMAEAARAGSGVAAAIVAFAEIGSEIDLAAVIAEHEAAAGGRLRGFRRLAMWDEDESLNFPALATRSGMLRSAAVAEHLRRLADHDLLFETWIYHPQLDDMVALASSAPRTAIVLGHAACPMGVGRHSDHRLALKEWQDGMARLAHCPNVHVKIGGMTGPRGLPAAARAVPGAPWTAPELADALKPYLSFVVETFGAQRCLFESNFPGEKAHCSMAVLLEAYSRALGGLSEADRAAIFAGNAARLYRIGR